MSNPEDGANVSLRVSRVVRASPERAFHAWTEPRRIMRWWGPAGASCPEATVDLRVGGEYAIANQFADGRIVSIRGTFETVEPPHRLVYTWHVDGAPRGLESERVTVLFEPLLDGATEIIVLHERIPTTKMRRDHVVGWAGCLDGLAAYIDSPVDADSVA